MTSNMTNTKTLDPIRKVAILISTLDHRVADELLERMSDEQAALVRNAAMELDEIPEGEQQQVMQEFLGKGDSEPAVDDSGIELDEELARKLSEGDSYEHRQRQATIDQEPPFRFLCDADAETIAKHLADENPQIIAVVLAHLPPRPAAELLQQFEPVLQANLMRRVAELDTADRDIVLEVEKHLKMLLQDDLRAAKNRAIGLSTVSSILSAAGGSRGQLISSLTRHDRQLAHQLRDPTRNASTNDHAVSLRIHVPDREVAAHHGVADEVASDVAPEGVASVGVMPRSGIAAFHFEELPQLTDAELALVFSQSDPKVAMLALAGATPKLVNRLMKQLGGREAKALRRRIEQLGPTRLSDIEQAQASIALIAARLIEGDEIDPPQIEHIAVAA